MGGGGVCVSRSVVHRKVESGASSIAGERGGMDRSEGIVLMR